MTESNTDKNTPWLKMCRISMPLPSLNDNTADADRFVKCFKKTACMDHINIPFTIVKKIPALFREYNYQCSAVFSCIKDNCTLIDIFPLHNNKLYAAAADIGSSTVVLRLVDILSGEYPGEVSFINPQYKVGADILSRIHYAAANGVEDLQKMLVHEINSQLRTLCCKHNIEPSEITCFAAAGNTTMTHFFLGLDPYWICREPYIPVLNTPDILSPSDMGLDINPCAPVIVMPGAGSYLGGDVVAGVLASGMNKNSGTSIMVDVGTNAEVVLGNSEWLMACAGAAGPALEGGVAAMGMMAGSGAIDKVAIDISTKEISVHTIGDAPPAGICGSGLIDLAAHLFLSGMIDLRGKFDREVCRGRLSEIDGVENLLIVPGDETESGNNIYLSQTDINALIRSKAAMYTILNTISEMANLDIHDVERFYIAGTFGAYIDPVSAISLGMIPDLSSEKFKSVGNTSLEGVTMALLSSENLETIYKIRDMITYIELNVNQKFMNNFSAAKFIPHTDRALFPSVRES